MALIDCKSLTLEELRFHLASMEVPAYRAAQIRSWLDRGVTNFDDMGNIPLKLRAELNKKFHISSVKIEKKLVSARDNTVKYLYALDDGENVESVLMEYHHGWSQCLSTQVGCKMGCSFCATGMDGYVRNLLASEMLAQIESAQSDHGVRVSSIVLMGMGEPLDNFDNVIRFLHLLGQPGGIQIGMRHVSLSTCGLVDKIYELMEYKLQLTLSVSLHAPNDNIRSQMMPINKRWPISELLKACSIYAKTTGRRISFEYAMVDGVNDSDECAMELAARLKGILCHVNLIPLNSVPKNKLRRSSDERLGSFKAILEKLGVNVTVRRTLGSDINASCGQLRRNKEKE
ncbi:MAG: 23S rRNA (adenine(2503)-C(2))-methyltransferase RlmN [Oscillospiraceae bacterium]|nr:23S rRNA (adenine(2503)-C(2))-methyltransferase RlmN [Oscillospiraceae bacterium]MDD4413898.1 23S rRNA (adenine(2503)-C(2))-methyltransferase RlmN [Oscillospiraceae bacterium]